MLYTTAQPRGCLIGGTRGNVAVAAVEESARRALADPATARQQLGLSGEFQLEEGAPQFRGTIPFFITMLLMTVLLIHVQELALWLPRKAFD